MTAMLMRLPSKLPTSILIHLEALVHGDCAVREFTAGEAFQGLGIRIVMMEMALGPSLAMKLRVTVQVR